MGKVEGASPEPRREIELDFIRGIAILLVLDFHSPHSVLSLVLAPLKLLHFGWAGVDIFFVLSGFLVGGLLLKEWKLKGRIDNKRFLIRRGFKIWPQYYFYLLIILFTGHRTFHELLGNFLNIQNYTGGIAHTWTLALEEHAYLLLVLLLALAVFARWTPRTFFLVLAGCATAVLTLRFVLVAHNVPDTLTRTDTRVDGILYGIMLAVLYHFAPARFQALQRLRPLLLTLFAACLAFILYAPRRPFFAAGTWFAADLAGITLLLLLYRHRPGKPRSALYRLVAAIGLYSYGIYLWHVSVIAPSYVISRKLPAGMVAPWLMLATPVAGILLGVLTTKLIEFPALKLRDRLFPRRVDSATGIPAEIEAHQTLPADAPSEPVST